MTLHLLRIGHRDVAMVSGRTGSNDRARERVIGVRETLQAHGLSLPAELFVETEFSIRNGRDALSKLLSSRLPFTAVVCGNDILALGVLTEAANRRVKVPKSLSVTGFDDIDLAGEWKPALTTVGLPVAEIGRRAAERMLSRIEGADVPRIEEVQVTLILCDSSGPAHKPVNDN